MIAYKYKYDGPVMVFDNIASNKWTGETVAVNKNKAMSNLKYQFKKKVKLLPTARVTMFPKYLKQVETVMM